MSCIQEILALLTALKRFKCKARSPDRAVTCALLRCPVLAYPEVFSFANSESELICLNNGESFDNRRCLSERSAG